MAVNAFLYRFGFDEDPFDSTNAEQEPRLATYFVPPPYFATVMGDPSQPKSHVVLAPRGGGKTAQRRMIEERSSADRSFLCVTYDNFDQPPGFSLDRASWAYHLNQICRLVLVGVLVALDENPALVDRLSEPQRQLLKFQLTRFLGNLSAAEFKAACDALKNFGDRAREFWNRWGKPVSAVLAMLLKRIGLENVPIPDHFAEEAKRDESLRFHFQSLSAIVQTLGFVSVYVLVDKVDETSLTNARAASSFALVRSLISDLPTLETPGVGFKFFLWDQIESEYREGGARPDRIPIMKLRWTFAELEAMLSARLRAYSNDKVATLNALIDPDGHLDLHKLVAYLANGSPRDMIRLSKRIVAEQTRTTDQARYVSDDAIWNGIRVFCDERTQELFGESLADMKRIGKPTFTINQLASDVYRISQQAVRAKVQAWQDSGMVTKIGEIPNPPNRPLYLFGVADVRVAIAMQPGAPVHQVLLNTILECPSCKAICANDRADINCPVCESTFPRSEARSLFDICRCVQPAPPSSVAASNPA